VFFRAVGSKQTRRTEVRARWVSTGMKKAYCACCALCVRRIKRTYNTNCRQRSSFPEGLGDSGRQGCLTGVLLVRSPSNQEGIITRTNPRTALHGWAGHNESEVSPRRLVPWKSLSETNRGTTHVTSSTPPRVRTAVRFRAGPQATPPSPRGLVLLNEGTGNSSLPLVSTHGGDKGASRRDAE
jgi:hypothetical protein